MATVCTDDDHHLEIRALQLALQRPSSPQRIFPALKVLDQRRVGLRPAGHTSAGGRTPRARRPRRMLFAFAAATEWFIAASVSARKRSPQWR
ncbi:MAG: hypothetical protein ACRDRT_01870 [Pseudonocardiaceae bacterium]